MQETTEYKVRCYSEDRFWDDWIDAEQVQAIDKGLIEDWILADPNVIGYEVVGIRTILRVYD